MFRVLASLVLVLWSFSASAGSWNCEDALIGGRLTPNVVRVLEGDARRVETIHVLLSIEGGTRAGDLERETVRTMQAAQVIAEGYDVDASWPRSQWHLDNRNAFITLTGRVGDLRTVLAQRPFDSLLWAGQNHSTAISEAYLSDGNGYATHNLAQMARRNLMLSLRRYGANGATVRVAGEAPHFSLHVYLSSGMDSTLLPNRMNGLEVVYITPAARPEPIAAEQAEATDKIALATSVRLNVVQDGVTRELRHLLAGDGRGMATIQLLMSIPHNNAREAVGRITNLMHALKEQGLEAHWRESGRFHAAGVTFVEVTGRVAALRYILGVQRQEVSPLLDEFLWAGLSATESTAHSYGIHGDEGRPARNLRYRAKENLRRILSRIPGMEEASLGYTSSSAEGATLNMLVLVPLAYNGSVEGFPREINGMSVTYRRAGRVTIGRPDVPMRLQRSNDVLDQARSASPDLSLLAPEVRSWYLSDDTDENATISIAVGTVRGTRSDYLVNSFDRVVGSGKYKVLHGSMKFGPLVLTRVNRAQLLEVLSLTGVRRVSISR